ncbi:MAG: hypothetical protein HY242_01705 [Afipia sp.]|nr:hypothetical protein [Afipia sp.]
MSKAALLRARDDCNARLAKQRPDAKLYQELNVAVRHPYSLARMLGPTRDDVIALMAPASWKGMFATTRGRLGCSYTIKDKKLTFRSLEFDGRRRKRLPNEKD